MITILRQASLAASDVCTKTSARTASTASVSRNRQQLYRYFPPTDTENQKHATWTLPWCHKFKLQDGNRKYSITHSRCYIENTENRV